VGERNKDCSLGDLRPTACNVADTSTANLVVVEARVVGKATLSASLRRIGAYEDLAAHGANFHERVICRSDNHRVAPSTKGDAP
jgi:hypothetical protein